MEAVRAQTPRYLYRLWSDGENPTGGRHGLNIVEAITPHGFADDLVSCIEYEAHCETRVASIYNCKASADLRLSLR